MQLRNKIFRRYYSVHGKFLGGQINIDRQRWFNNLCETNYAKHILSGGGKILEIGCGKGYILKYLQSKGYSNIDGIDLSPEDVEIAKKYVEIDNIYCADALEELLRKKGVYDCIIGKDILEHVEKDKIDEFLNSIKNALKPSGRVILQVPNMDWIMAQHERYMDLTHEVGFTRESFGELLRLYFDEVDIFPVNYDFPLSIKAKIAFKIMKPIAIKFTRALLTIIGAGAGACWFEYREILGVGIKKS